MDKHLHIVCFQPPYPPDFGGRIDVFYKLVALSDAGVKIHLHCFTDNDHHPSELKKYCTEIQYYPRKKGLSGLALSLPYIVASRRDPALLERLLLDRYPILLEGIHCSFLLDDARFAGRNIMLRLHNVEHIYYQKLIPGSPSLFRRAYYAFESWLLKKYERKIASLPVAIWGMSKTDLAYYRDRYGAANLEWLPAFFGFTKLNSEWQRAGSYCLYHGNLSVAENEKAALWLMRKVFYDLTIPFIVAGKSPSRRLRKHAARFGVQLIADPSEEQMQALIAGASCHVLPSFNATGVKLKLINALFNGRHCITNTAGVSGSGLAACCHIADTEADFCKLVKELHPLPLTSQAAETREKILLQIFDPTVNTRRILEWMRGDGQVAGA